MVSVPQGEELGRGRLMRAGHACSVRTTVLISVLDVNDNTPAFLGEPYAATLSEVGVAPTGQPWPLMPRLLLLAGL